MTFFPVRRGLSAAFAGTAALLAACTEPAPAVVEAKRDVGVPAAAIQDFAPVYPGARVTTRVGAPSPDGANGTTLIMETSDPVDKVMAFYDARAKEAGMIASMIASDDEGAVRMFGSADGPGRPARGALIAVSRSDDGRTTEIVITGGEAAARAEAGADAQARAEARTDARADALAAEAERRAEQPRPQVRLQ